MSSQGEIDGQEKAAAEPAAGRSDAPALEEDVFAKQEKLFDTASAENPS